jgi:hypothetical protein
MRAEQLIDKLNQDGQLPKEELLELIRSRRELSGQTRAYLYHLAKQKAEACFGHDIYVRGLIEFTNYCRKRLPVLRHPKRQRRCAKIPPDEGGDSRVCG